MLIWSPDVFEKKKSLNCPVCFKMLAKVVVLLFALNFANCGDEKRDYSNYHIVRFFVENLIQQKAIETFFDSNPKNVQFLREGSDSKNEIDLAVHPDYVQETLQFASGLSMKSEILENNLQRSIEIENVPTNQELFDFESRNKEGKSCFGTFSFRKYHQFNIISDFIDCIADQYSHLANMIEIGKSSEGRPIKVMKISKPGTKAGRPSIFIEGGIHAREWISPASVLYILYEFVVNNHKYQDIFDNYEVYILPVLNPDG